MKRFAGVYITEGEVRRLTFEARDLEEARQLGKRRNVGVEGEATESFATPAPLPEAYD